MVAAQTFAVPIPEELERPFQELDPDASLPARLDSLEDVAQWLFHVPRSHIRHPELVQLARIRQLLEVTDSSPSMVQKLRATMAGVLRETTAVALFADAGIPNDRGMFSESIDRISKRILPQPPDDGDLEHFVSRVFRRKRDCAWIEVITPELFAEIAQLLGDIWAPIREAMADAVALLCTRVSALGLSAALRDGTEQKQVRDNAFFRLPHVPLEELPMVMLECRRELTLIHERLEHQGVNVDVVYRVDTIRRMLARVELMLPLLSTRGDPKERLEAGQRLLAALTAGRISDLSIRQLARENLGVLARRVIERVGQSKESYVTSSRREYWRMFASAAGGGVITAFTVIGRFFARWADLAPFIDGTLSAGIYAGSFLAMQFLGLTLATKQPSILAAALAKTIQQSKSGEQHQLDDLVTLIARIARSQVAAAFGNMLTIIPVVLLFDMGWVYITGHHFLSDARAGAEIASFDPLHTGTIWFAAVTGVLLWMSSLGAGWLENWVTYRRLPEALRAHRVSRVVGVGPMAKLADFITKHTADIGGNVTLGLLLGFAPVIGALVALPFEVRHITFATGSLTFAVASLGIDHLTVSAIVGVVIIGVVSFAVSLSLALAVALRARDVSSSFGLIAAVMRYFVRHPFRFFFPPKDAQSLVKGYAPRSS